MFRQMMVTPIAQVVAIPICELQSVHFCEPAEQAEIVRW